VLIISDVLDRENQLNEEKSKAAGEYLKLKTPQL
jgi:hypothetical protein